MWSEQTCMYNILRAGHTKHKLVKKSFIACSASACPVGSSYTVWTVWKVRSLPNSAMQAHVSYKPLTWSSNFWVCPSPTSVLMCINSITNVTVWQAQGGGCQRSIFIWRPNWKRHSKSTIQPLLVRLTTGYTSTTRRGADSPALEEQGQIPLSLVSFVWNGC